MIKHGTINQWVRLTGLVGRPNTNRKPLFRKLELSSFAINTARRRGWKVHSIRCLSAINFKSGLKITLAWSKNRIIVISEKPMKYTEIELDVLQLTDNINTLYQ